MVYLCTLRYGSVCGNEEDVVPAALIHAAFERYWNAMYKYVKRTGTATVLPLSTPDTRKLIKQSTMAFWVPGHVHGKAYVRDPMRYVLQYVETLAAQIMTVRTRRPAISMGGALYRWLMLNLQPASARALTDFLTNPPPLLPLPVEPVATAAAVAGTAVAGTAVAEPPRPSASPAYPPAMQLMFTTMTPVVPGAVPAAQPGPLRHGSRADYIPVPGAISQVPPAS